MIVLVILIMDCIVNYIVDCSVGYKKKIEK